MIRHLANSRRSLGAGPGALKGGHRLLVLVPAVLVLPAALLLAACNLGDDFAEDLVEKAAKRNEERRLQQQREELPLPDPERVPYRSYSSEALAVRDDFQVSLADDLVLGEGRTDPEYLFVSLSGSNAALGNVAVDGAGRIYVLETRAGEVRVFDRDGSFLFRFGRPGEGPGDFQRPFGIAVVGSQVRVYHRGFFCSLWSLEGTYVDDRRILEETADAAEAENARQASRFRTPTAVIGRPDGSAIMVWRAEPEEAKNRVMTPFVRVIGRFEAGREVERFMEVPEWANPALAVAANGDMYVGMFGHLRSEHYIVALDAAGAPRWTLVTQWPAALPPRADLRVDGGGRLFVFPNFQTYFTAPPEQVEGAEGAARKAKIRPADLPARDESLPPGYALDAEDPRRPLQVYTRDGELIGSGYLDRKPVWQNWQVTQGDLVFGVRINPETQEWEVVRYRLRIAGGSG